MSSPASYSGKELMDALTLLALVKSRPCVKKSGDRMTLIGYAEITTLEKWLRSAYTGPTSEAELDAISETYIDRLPSNNIKDVLQSMRDFESRCGAYFAAEAYASYVNTQPEYAKMWLKQLEDSGDVMSTKAAGQVLWHVLT